MATTLEAPHAPPCIDPVFPGDFFKGGFANQLLYVAPRKEVVIAYFGTNQSLDSRPHLLSLRQMIEDLF